MSFMQNQVTRKLFWYEIDTPCGTFAIPVEDAGLGAKLNDLLRAQEWDSLTEEQQEEVSDVLLQYCEAQSIDSVQVREGYGARLSAPGYMDCTEWSVFDSPEEASAYLEEMYPDEDNEESEEA